MIAFINEKMKRSTDDNASSRSSSIHSVKKQQKQNGAKVSIVIYREVKRSNNPINHTSAPRVPSVRGYPHDQSARPRPPAAARARGGGGGQREARRGALPGRPRPHAGEQIDMYCIEYTDV